MNKILNVLYQSNDYYAPITGVSVTSLMEHNQDLDEMNVYLLNDKISKDNLEKFKGACDDYGRNLIIIETEDILRKLRDELKVSPFKGTYTTYFKLIAISSLDLPTDRVLQLDGDTIIIGSLAPLCDLDLSDALIAATYDCILNEYKALIDIPLTDKFYNGGILLVNQKKWLEEDCEGQIVHHLKYVRNGYYTVDQDILNVLFRKQIKYLDLKYNFNSGFYIYGIEESFKMYDLKEEYYNTIEEVKEAYRKPIIHHCMGAMTGRPWEQNSIHPQNELFDKYLKISRWKDFEKVAVNRKMIFQIQRFLYLVLPRILYIRFHKKGLKRYLEKMNKLVQDWHPKENVGKDGTK
jgi:lipopolysaccharide biosynthesis glycosyltransferase